MNAKRVVAVLLACALLAVGCGQRQVTASAAPETSPDALVVGLDEVRAIVADDSLQFTERDDRGQPEAIDPAAPGPCWAVSDEAAVFDGGGTRFRAVEYRAPMTATPTGKGFPTVTQAIGGYPSGDAAHGAFDRLGPALHDCAALGVDSYTFTLARPDPATITLAFPGTARATVIYHVQGAVLTRVSALALDESDRIAGGVSQAIADRIG